MATAAGSTKMPAPMVALMMFAVSSRVPITRTSCSSGDVGLPVVGNANLRVPQIVPQHHHDEHYFHLEAIAHACDLQRNLIVQMPVVQTFPDRSEEHTSELQSHHDLVCRLLLEKKNNKATR